jgi:hypothetical protein
LRERRTSTDPASSLNQDSWSVRALGRARSWSVRERKGNLMKTLSCIVATAAFLISIPAMIQQASAQQGYGSGSTNIWSSAQGTSNSYGAAQGFGTSTSGSMASAGGQGLSGAGGFGGGGRTSAITTSTAGTVSYGSGYAQSQTSGYAGGNVSGLGGRTH